MIITPILMLVLGSLEPIIQQDKSDNEILKSHKSSRLGEEMEVVATAYTSSPRENGGYTVTATGHPLIVSNNIIAVDPKVIPLGSTVYINGKAYKALDTGGAIKGKRIDILMTRSDMNRWGRRKITVYVVKFHGTVSRHKPRKSRIKSAQTKKVTTSTSKKS